MHFNFITLIKTVDELTKLLRDVVCKVLNQSRWFANQHFQKKNSNRIHYKNYCMVI